MSATSTWSSSYQHYQLLLQHHVPTTTTIVPKCTGKDCQTSATSSLPPRYRPTTLCCKFFIHCGGTTTRAQTCWLETQVFHFIMSLKLHVAHRLVVIDNFWIFVFCFFFFLYLWVWLVEVTWVKRQPMLCSTWYYFMVKWAQIVQPTTWPPPMFKNKRCTYRQTDRRTNEQSFNWTDRQTVSQIERQTDRLTFWQMNGRINYKIKINVIGVDYAFPHYYIMALVFHELGLITGLMASINWLFKSCIFCGSFRIYRRLINQLIINDVVLTSYAVKILIFFNIC